MLHPCPHSPDDALVVAQNKSAVHHPGGLRGFPQGTIWHETKAQRLLHVAASHGRHGAQTHPP